MNAAEKAMQAAKMQNAAKIQKLYQKAHELLIDRKYEKATKLLCDCVDMEHEESLDVICKEILKPRVYNPYHNLSGGLKKRLGVIVRSGGERGDPNCLGVLRKYSDLAGGMDAHWKELCEKKYEEAEEEYVRVLLNYKTYAGVVFHPEKLNEEDEALYKVATDTIRKLDFGFEGAERYTDMWRDADWGRPVDYILSRYPKAVRRVTGK